MKLRQEIDFLIFKSLDSIELSKKLISYSKNKSLQDFIDFIEDNIKQVEQDKKNILLKNYLAIQKEIIKRNKNIFYKLLYRILR